MTAAEFTPLHEWEPAIGERVKEWNDQDVIGTVVRCDRYGHVGDPYWRVSVRWDCGGYSDNLETSRLLREDGTQGPR